MCGKTTRSVAAVTCLAAAVLLGVAVMWWQRHRNLSKVAPTGPLSPASAHTVPSAPSPVPDNTNRDANGSGGDVFQTAGQPSRRSRKIDWSRTSWQEPFAAEYWRSSGWRFDGDSMRCAQGTAAEATFRRRYTKLMLSLDVSTGTFPATFRVRLTEPNSGTSTVVAFSSDAVVSTVVPGAASSVIERRPLDPPLIPGGTRQLRIAATGNRIAISWNGRRVLVCDQPIRQSGRELAITLASDGAGLRISRLRIEGE